MVFALKALIGAVVAGTGALVPIAVNKAKESNLISEDVAKLIEGTSTFKGIKARDDENNKNIKISKSLKELQNKNCQLVKNPKKENKFFDALYGCKDSSTKKAEFYYLGSVDSIQKKQGSSLKKVVSVNYNEVDNSKAHLTIKFDGAKQEVNWSVEVGSVWRYFKEVNLNEKCSIDTLGLGGDVLRCELKDEARERAVFQYIAAVF